MTKIKERKTISDKMILSLMEEIYLSIKTNDGRALTSIAKEANIAPSYIFHMRKLDIIEPVEQIGKVKRFIWKHENEPDLSLAQIVIMAKKKTDLEYFHKADERKKLEKENEKKLNGEVTKDDKPATENKDEEAERLSSKSVIKVNDEEKAVVLMTKDIYLGIKSAKGKISLSDVATRHGLSRRYVSALLEGGLVTNTGMHNKPVYVWTSVIEPNLKMAQETIKRKKAIDQRYEEAKTKRIQENNDNIERRMQTMHSHENMKKNEVAKQLQGIVELKITPPIETSVMQFLKTNNYHPHATEKMRIIDFHALYEKWCSKKELNPLIPRRFNKEIREHTNIKIDMFNAYTNIWLTKIDMRSNIDEEISEPQPQKEIFERPLSMDDVQENPKQEVETTDKAEEPIVKAPESSIKEDVVEEVIVEAKEMEVKAEPEPIPEPKPIIMQDTEKTIQLSKEVAKYRAFLLEVLEDTETGKPKRFQKDTRIEDMRKKILKFMKQSLVD